MPMSGNSKMGSSAVNGMGMASVIQNTTISTVTPSTRWPTTVNPSGVGIKPMISISRIPTMNPILRTLNLPIESPPHIMLDQMVFPPPSNPGLLHRASLPRYYSKTRANPSNPVILFFDFLYKPLSEKSASSTNSWIKLPTGRKNTSIFYQFY